MDKHVLVIMSCYYPDASSNTMCTLPLLEALIGRGAQIDLITSRCSPKALPFETDRGMRVYRIDHRRELSARRWQMRLETASGVKRAALSVGSLISRGGSRLTSRVFGYSEPRWYHWNRREVVRLACRLNEERAYDLVLSVSLPFVCHDMARDFLLASGSKAGWAMLEFDPYYGNAMIKGIFMRGISRRAQQRCYERCDLALMSRELYAYNLRAGGEFAAYAPRFRAISYANMKRPEATPSAHIAHDRPVLYYGGFIYSGIREPILAFDVLGRINEDYRFRLFTDVDLAPYAEWSAALGDHLEISPTVPPDEALREMNSADLLVSLGNTVPFQVPGKTFEFMASGLPIIHFSPCGEDAAPGYLARYPHALIVRKGDDPARAAARVADFIRENAGKRASYDEVLACMPELDNCRVTEDFCGLIEPYIRRTR